MLPKEIGRELKNFLRDNDLTQAEVAQAVNTDQPRISRIVQGNFRRVTGTVRRICEYANISVDDYDDNPANNAELMDALALVWDGTDHRARALAKVIRSLKELS